MATSITFTPAPASVGSGALDNSVSSFNFASSCAITHQATALVCWNRASQTTQLDHLDSKLCSTALWNQSCARTISSTSIESGSATSQPRLGGGKALHGATSTSEVVPLQARLALSAHPWRSRRQPAPNHSLGNGREAASLEVEMGGDVVLEWRVPRSSSLNKLVVVWRLRTAAKHDQSTHSFLEPDTPACWHFTLKPRIVASRCTAVETVRTQCPVSNHIV
eukprot:3609734-Amphidinium_carterae.1